MAVAVQVGDGDAAGRGEGLDRALHEPASRLLEPADLRALALEVRDAWKPRGREMPYIRAAGCWVGRKGTLPDGLAVDAEHADELMSAAMRQLDDGADLIKLYLDGSDKESAPWSTEEAAAVVDAVHARDAKVTAHATNLPGTRLGAAAGVDAIEHGFELDDDVVAEMVRKDIFLVSTLAVTSSWQSFGATTEIERFTGSEGRAERALGAEIEAEVELDHVGRQRLGLSAPVAPDLDAIALLVGGEMLRKRGPAAEAPR